MDWDLTVKISDFGLARVLQENKEYYRITPGKGNQLPIRWVALEGLTDGIFTSKSDVVSPYQSNVKALTGSYLIIQWSYGITLWEVMAIGKTPYPGVPISDFIKLLEEGMRLSQPMHSPERM